MRHAGIVARARRALVTSIAVTLAATAAHTSAPPAAIAGGGPRLRCDAIVFRVGLAPGQPADERVVGWLCSRGPLADKTIQVLVHGATYDHNVWDFPYRPDRYSYVRAATDAGYATLNMDRLGHGLSSRVPGDQLDLTVGAYALHQVVQKLRSGTLHTHQLGHVEPEKILLAGESLGGNLVWTEAATYGDVDGLVVAGSAHSFGPGLDYLLQVTVPVEQDPILRPMYPDDLTDPKRHLALFLAQYWGGPGTYSEERGHPRLRMRHVPFVVDAAARDAWLTHMEAAVAADPPDPEANDELLAYLRHAADFLVNHPG